MSIEKKIIQPDGWAPTIGYANGILVSPGKILFIAGQVGWDENEIIQSTEIGPQFEQALKNILAILKKAGGGAEHICRMTCYCTDKKKYIEARREIGKAWKQLLGKNFPAMSMIFVADLLAPQSLIEIETTAVIPEK
ncbi:RidA family protein [Desulfobacula phenolica]|uniref:Enamine deaminase RidA, house cleaning of reactive enamine intermediates, YjgF/YER057c/UK114 family n=1 Tax=Desulfobacula phenolica TaxID=90732 RepID=A0A1H2IBA5_9BACT|nr:RidA family protein [Desulfobacula phenolica]SDU41399.1 Enamine deaminase RidA, house cleaning of reactive enamine intermediates, YjgF/YER057c/UK114 family [Desulfobacula phenolica]